MEKPFVKLKVHEFESANPSDKIYARPSIGEWVKLRQLFEGKIGYLVVIGRKQDA